MVKSFVQSIKEFIARYLEKGIEVLLNCQDYPEYHDILSNLKQLDIESFGIRSANRSKYFKEGKISYFNIMEDNSMCIGVFCLSKGSKLSLHDHPGMMVFSKVLCGKVHRRNMDLVDRDAQFRLAKKVYQDNDLSPIGTLLDAEVVSDDIYSPGDILNLAPNKGNIHSFFALEDTAFLDVLLPNYDNEERFCNFYYELDTESDNSDEEAIEKDASTKILQKLQKVELSKAESSKGSEEKQMVKLVYALPPSDLDIILLEYDGDALV